jgi:putative toxin-antitoxin system antitoxin component (TIGR02293 family)
MGEFSQSDYASLAAANDFQLVEISRSSFKVKDLLSVAEKSGFPLEDWAKWLHISSFDNLSQRGGDEALEPLQAERLLELARLFHYGEEVFGDPAMFRKWLRHKIVALGDIEPVSLLDNSFGIDIVRTELGRIEHGIFA